MKAYLCIVICLSVHFCQAQADTSISKKPHFVSYVVRMDTIRYTKEGFYMHGYVVHINRSELQNLRSKTVKVSGRATVVKGIPPYVPGKPVMQGRTGDTMHIIKPEFTIIPD